MNELISIIVPVYNVQKYLPRCIDSIINQTYKNLEIIVVDDGSTDDSGKICDEYAKKDNRIRVIHKENGGLSEARNIGINQANGDLIGFIDSDDYISKDMFEILRKSLIKYQTDISICNIQNVNEDGVRLSTQMDYHEEKTQVLEKKEALQLLLEDKIKSYAWNKLYKIELFDDIRYPKGKKMEDLATTYQLFDRATRVVFNQEICYYYVYRKNSILHHVNNSLMIDWNYAINERYNFLIDKYSDLKESLIINRLLCTALFFKFFYQLKSKDTELEKILDKEYLFYKKYFKTYQKKLNRNKSIKTRTELWLLFFSRTIYKVYVFGIKLIKRG